MSNQPLITSASIEAKRTFSKEITKLRRNQQILTILVLLLVSMAFWIIVSLFSSQRSTKISPDINKLAEPLVPTLDTSVLDTIDSKVTYTTEELADFPIMVIVNDTQTQEERIVPIGTAVLPSTRTTSPARPATTSSQLQQVLSTPAPTPNTTETQ